MNTDTLLLRQVHPNFVQADKISAQVFSITSQVFRPTPKDEFKLSVYNGEKFGAEQSHTHFTSTEPNKSIGVVAVTMGECAGESLNASEDNDPFDGHCVIDFTGKTNNQIEKASKRLKAFAMERGWLFKTAQ